MQSRDPKSLPHFQSRNPGIEHLPLQAGQELPNWLQSQYFVIMIVVFAQYYVQQRIFITVSL